MAGPGSASVRPHLPGWGGTHLVGRTLLVAVCLLAGLVYLNSLANGFALDDTSIIQENPRVHGLGALPQAVTGPYWPTGVPRLGMYRPLTMATFAVDWEIWNGRPFGFHLTNVLLHMGVTGLLFILLVGMGAGVAGATAGAAIFAVHPVHVEAVANVVGRAELLAALFFLAACLAYARLRPGWRSALVVGALYLLSLLSKEMGVTLPGALVLVHMARGGSFRAGLEAAGRRWRVYLVLTLALATYLLLRWANTGAFFGGEAPWFWGEPASTRIWTSIRILPEFLRLMVFPLELVPDYGPAVIVPERTWVSPLVLLGFLTALVVATVAFAAWARSRLVAVGILWFAGTVLPIWGLLFPVGVLVAERTLYLPSVGLAIAIAGLAAPLLTARLRPWAVATLSLLVLAAGYRTWIQNPVWRDNDSVIGHLLVHHPDNYRSQWVLARQQLDRGDTAGGLARFALVSRMVPGHHRIRIEYGLELYEHGHFAAAAVQFDTARQVIPDIIAGHIYHLRSLLADGRPAEVVAAMPGVVAHFPNSLIVHHLHALALARTGDLDGAAAARLRAARLDDGESRYLQWVNLAALQLAAGRPEHAVMALDTARAHAPDPQQVPSPAQLERRLAEGRTGAIPFW